MPFHIAHSGPAPVQTFFRPKPAPSTLPGAAPESEAEIDAALPARHVAAFRGRTVHGLDIPAPAGYAGAVLRLSSPARATRAVTSKAQAQAARRGSRSRGRAVIDVDAHEEGDMEEDAEEGEARVFEVAGQFDRLVLWHPDNPVDEGKDEYVRALREWVALAAEIHRVDE